MILKEEGIITEESFAISYPAQYFPVGDTAIWKRLCRFFSGTDKKALIREHAGNPENHSVRGNPNRERTDRRGRTSEYLHPTSEPSH